MNDTATKTLSNATVQRRRLLVEGLVQGVGFRPHVHRLATKLALGGYAENTGRGLTIEIEGSRDSLDEFVRRLKTDAPSLARVHDVHEETLAPLGAQTFAIRDGLGSPAATTLLPPDVATCEDCLHEMGDPANRRYRYPFTNCTNCGPRYSILESLPYDRVRTTMHGFDMCDACASEYTDPADRRFHAQPIACPDCGPQIHVAKDADNVSASCDDALSIAAQEIRRGRIVAMKGLGGFQLLVDARNGEAVARLRERKKRPDKPFAVMFPDVDSVAEHLQVSELERELLTSKEAPIVLLRHRESPADYNCTAVDTVAPQNPYIGAMLPYTPLHHLLMRDLQFPIVATSGNVAEEPMVTDDAEAFELLGGIADIFLVHDRPIAAAVDDSVVQVVADRPLMLRRARGYAPRTFALPQTSVPLTALGGHLKSAVAISTGSGIVLGPYIGNLDSQRARTTFKRSLAHLSRLHNTPQCTVACDQHPDYFTTGIAKDLGPTVVPVQHHVAHVAACMADNEIDGPVLGVAWDGTGYGDDGTVWGGEFFDVNGSSAVRMAHMRLFSLPGGDAAVAEPRRAAAGLLYEIFNDHLWDHAPSAFTEQFSDEEKTLLLPMLTQQINAPRTSSAGRLFDAVAALVGLVQRTSFEGQAAMALEYAVVADEQVECRYKFKLIHTNSENKVPAILDWEPVICDILRDVAGGRPMAHIAADWHSALADVIVAVARMADEKPVVVTGGCFQNRCLSETTISRLRTAGFKPIWHRHLPPNDGNLAVGQAAWAMHHLEKPKPCV